MNAIPPSFAAELIQEVKMLHEKRRRHMNYIKQRRIAAMKRAKKAARRRAATAAAATAKDNLDSLADFWIAKAWDTEQFGLEHDLEEEEGEHTTSWLMELIAFSSSSSAARYDDDGTCRRSQRIFRKVPSRFV